MTDTGLEAALAATEEQVDAALKATAALTRELKKAKTGAVRGQLRELRRALSSTAALSADSARATEGASASFVLDEQEHLASGAYAQELLDEAAAQTEAGMRHIERNLIPLAPPDEAELDRAYHTLRQLHGAAYGWEPPDVAGLERLGATRMRQYVRAWINEWDLVRIDPGYRPVTDVVDVPATTESSRSWTTTPPDRDERK
ncbi:MAG: hypothetical protein M3Q82_09000 [Actinomycetota bacterium]|nr:hypothetical protein [Actinomycetota bacterium]